MMEAMLSNPRHPEYGQVTIRFPIPRQKYDQTLESLNAMGLGAVLGCDCRVDAVSEDTPALQFLEGATINLDELDYLTRRLADLSPQEQTMFQSAAAWMGVTRVEDLINLFFHKNSGFSVMMSFENQEVVYYGGRFPTSLYDDWNMMVGVGLDGMRESAPPLCWLYLPMAERQLDRELMRNGITDRKNLSLCPRLRAPAASENVPLGGKSLTELNELAEGLAQTHQQMQTKTQGFQMGGLK